MNRTTLKTAALLTAGALLGASPALALDGKVVLDQLVKKGVLTPEEADAIVKKDTEKKTTEQLGPVKKEEKWYDKLKIDGYVQVRYTEQLNDTADYLDVPADKSVNPRTGLMIRRGRVKLTGDITKKIHLYSQLDFQGSTGGSSAALQARDLYADFDIDDDAESRVRVGLSKVPYGWSNLQSSQNRLAMERPDALNSGVEGERDYGIYYMWANKESRELFKSLVKDGLKGSGDYGVVTVGAYNGQGLNKPDLNEEPHVVARVSYPFKISDQIFETGVGGYAGKYVVTKSSGAIAGGDRISSTTADFRDDRVFATFIMYPQPFGIEAELTCGKGPQLNDARNRIDEAFLWGGYIMANYRIQSDGMEYIPFVRWNYYDGARKFATNAPQDKVNEFDIGTEIQFGKAWEFTLCYTYTKDRTNTSTSPYAMVSDAHRLSAQLQFNF